MRALPLLLLLVAAAHAAPPPADVLQGGLLGGVGPAEPLYTHVVLGGWVGVGLGDTWRLELTGTWQDGLESETDISTFLRTEALLDEDDALADRTVWTVDLLLRAEPLRGKVAALQTTLGGFTAHVGGGAGLRAQRSRTDDDHLAPSVLAAAGADLRLLDWLLLRLDLRAFALLRRDDTVGGGAELLLGAGARL